MVLTQQPQIKLATELVRKAAPAPQPVIMPQPAPVAWMHGSGLLIMAGLRAALTTVHWKPRAGVWFLACEALSLQICIHGPVILDSSTTTMSVPNSLLCCRNNMGQPSQKNCPGREGRMFGISLCAGRAGRALGQAQSLREGPSPMAFLFH